MMLVDRAIEVQINVKEVVQLRAVVDQQKVFQERARQIRKGLEALSRLGAVVSELRRRGALVDIDGATIGALGHRAIELLAAFQNDRSVLRRGDSEQTYAFWNQLDEVPGQLDQHVRQSWTRHLDFLVTDADRSNLRSVLPTLGAGVPGVNRVVEILGEFKRLRSGLPTPPDTFDEAERLADELADLLVRIKGVPDEVVRFLQAAGSPGGARLELLTTEVRAWLAERDSLDQFRIRQQASPEPVTGVQPPRPRRRSGRS